MGWKRFAVVLMATMASGATISVAEETVEADSYVLQCIPVATIWPVPSGWERSRPGPNLAVVDTHVRPKRSHLLLDGRAIGPASAFDGSPDYLYLEPGRYRLVARLGGYRTAVFDVEARSGCRYDLRHRMKRLEGVAKESRSSSRIGPFERVFAPLAGVEKGSSERAVAPRPSGPDLGLRPDLKRLQAARAAPPRGSASLQLRIMPLEAKVLLDGELVATGKEIAEMHQPLSVSSGPHVLEVTAAGHVPVSTRFDLAAGERREIRVDLEEMEKGAPEGSDSGAGQPSRLDVYSR